jgi:hypothetical protein
MLEFKAIIRYLCIGAEYMLKLYDSIIIKRITKKYIFNILKNLNNGSVQNVFLLRMDAPALQSILNSLLCLLTISVILPAAASSSLSLSVPQLLMYQMKAFMRLYSHPALMPAVCLPAY